MKLVKLSKNYEEQLHEMLGEWIKYNKENPTANHSPWAIFKNDHLDFDYYLENLEIKEETETRVPDSTYFLLDEDRNIFIGAVNIRHKLKGSLLITGGHIGDGIRPSERHKGYGTLLLKLALLEAQKLGINKVLITCDKTNIGSAKCITNNGGILENEVVNEEGVLEQRYWINL